LNSTVQWNGTPIATTYGSATTLNAILPASSLATATIAMVTVLNLPPGGGTSSAVDFSVDNPGPMISNINPASLLAGSGNTLLDITGSGFVSTSVIAWNGTALPTTFVSGTEVKATLPATDLAGSSASQIDVQNPAPGGGSSAAATFSVNSPAPVITAISPHYVAPGSAATITITGTGFEANSVVLWNGAARLTVVVSSTVLQVTLSASDLQNQGTGSLTISNPAPAASTSPGAQLTVTSQPVPVIQSVNVVNAPGTPGSCPQLQVTITGQNFASDSTIQANGVSLQGLSSGAPTTLVNYLPLGFVSAPGALTFTVTNPDLGPIVSNPFPYPTTNAPALALCASPYGTTVFSDSSFSITVEPSEVNISGNGTLTLGSLPTGITSTTSSVALPPSGTTMHLQAASSIAAGTYNLALSGSAGSATATGNFSFTVSTSAPPSFGFLMPLQTEVGVPIGGSGSIQYGTLVGGNGSVDYDITPSVTGLPPGTSATFSPTVFSAGGSVTVTLSAAGTAPVTQNASVTLTGTPSAQISNATASFFVDVTQPPGSLPGNRSDFTATAGTPYAAAYDATHNLIFSSNPAWNRVDVISNVTHKIVKSVPVRSPRGLDITQNNSTVWVQTASQYLYAINTASLQATQYPLPSHAIGSSGLPIQSGSDALLALSDGTLFVYFNDSGNGGAGEAGVWNPLTNQLNMLSDGTPSAWGIPVRSGDGTHVYASNNTYGTGIEVYEVPTQSLSTVGQGTNYAPVVAVNGDGSELVLGTSSSLALYDSSVNLLGSVPGALTGFGPDFPLDGGVLFSADNAKLYEIGVYNGVAAILTIDVSSLAVLGAAPSAPTDPVGTSGEAGTATPFAIDATGMVLGLQNYGISFDDSIFYQNYPADHPSFTGASEYIATFAGPLAGGTVSTLNSFPALTPDVWFGQTHGSASLSQAGLTFISPPSTMPGPVNVKFIYPDGGQAFYPQLFSYSTFPQYALMSGSSPNGGAPAQVLGYGLPQDASGGTLTVGGSTATITTTAGQYPPLSGEPYPSTILAYTFPAGAPGWADLQITTPIGTGTLPKSIFYAKSVTDYPSSDSFTAVLVDATRNQVYLSAGDHVDAFSTSSNQFVTPLYPAAVGTQKQFTGLALTPDGSQLLVADLLDGSLAVINPDTPSSTYAMALAPVTQVNGCPVGPLYVASTSMNQAFVSMGSLPVPSCPPSGNTYIANLGTHMATQPPANAVCGASGSSLDASGDGNYIVLGSPACIYAVPNSTYNLEPFPYGVNDEFGMNISADGNVVGSNQTLGDVNLDLLGSVANPVPFYGNTTFPPQASTVLLRPRFNASGSLYYFSYPNYFEIIDVEHATLRMRFSLTETIQNTASPLAIDSGGRYVYLLTNNGLTVVDLGAAPLSIGHLSPQNASPGTEIVVRGSGFDSGTTATVGGLAATVTFTDQNTLTLTVPAAAAGPEDIVLTRSDGETYTLENGVVLP
jgi:IPT/TIG domain